MSSSRSVYTTVGGKRLGAQLYAERSQVLVWLSNGPMLGFYNLDRFEGSKLTAKTLAQLFTPSEES